jgi:hypothetical protein
VGKKGELARSVSRPKAGNGPTETEGEEEDGHAGALDRGGAAVANGQRPSPVVSERDAARMRTARKR